MVFATFAAKQIKINLHVLCVKVAMVIKDCAELYMNCNTAFYLFVSALNTETYALASM